jgi:hypothetical protein
MENAKTEMDDKFYSKTYLSKVCFLLGPFWAHFALKGLQVKFFLSMKTTKKQNLMLISNPFKKVK